MNNFGIRRRSLITVFFVFFALTVIALLGVLSILGCGTGSNTHGSIVKSGSTPPTPGLSVAINPASVSVSQGNVSSYNVVITETGGFSSPITLSATGLPSGATATFSALTPTATGATATMSVSTILSAQEDSAIVVNQSKSAKPAILPVPGKPATRTGTLPTYVAVGSYPNIVVTAVGGGITQSSNGVTFVVTTAQDFTITLAPATTGSNVVAPGGTAKFIITATSIAGFSTPITLTLGSLSVFPQNQGLSATFGTTTLTPTAAGATTTLTVSTSTNAGSLTNPAAYALMVTGTAGTSVRTAGATLDIGAFSLSVTEASAGSGTVLPGGTAHYKVTLTSINGFAPAVTLTKPALPAGCTATFGSPTLTPGPSPKGATTTLTITTSGAGRPTPTQPQTVDFEVGGGGGGWNTDGSAQLNVTGFSVTVTEASAGSGTVLPGGTAHYIVTLTSINGYAPVVKLTKPALPAGCTAAFGSPTLTPGPSPKGATTTLTITTSGAGSPTTTQPQSADFEVGGEGVGWRTDGSAQLNVAGFSVTVTEASAGSGTVVAGGTAHYIVTLTSINGFAPVVTLTKPALPAGCTATFGSPTLTPGPSPKGATTTLTITTSGAGSPTPTQPKSVDFEVGGAGGGWNTDGSAQLNVTGFSITVSPRIFDVAAPGGGSCVVTVTALNGFSSPVTLTSNVFVGRFSDYSYSFNPSIVTPTAGGATSTFALFTKYSQPGPGGLAVKITGTAGGLSISTTVSVDIIPVKPKD